MADMITRCPKCGTAFRISDALLKSAKGVVRCGSCLSVFNAREHLESGRTSVVPTTKSVQPEAPEPARPFSSSTASHTPQKQATDFSRESVPLFDPPVSPTRQSFTELEEDDVDMPDWRRRGGNEQSYEPAATEPTPNSDDNDIDEEDDEAWALELLKDDDDLNIQFKKVTPKIPESAVDSTDADDHSAATVIVEEEPPLQAAPPADDVFAAIDEDLESLRPTTEESSLPLVGAIDGPEPDEGHTNAAPDSYAHADDTFFDDNHELRSEAEPDEAAMAERDAPTEEPAVTPTIAQEQPVKRKPIRPKLEPKSTPLKDVIASLEPEPLEVDWQEPGAWRRRLLWPLLALIALLSLLAQVAWLEFDRLSRVEPYRSAYGIACRIVGCQLPELLDRSQIHTSNLLVRSHPEVAGALQVDVILQNNAPFEQTFPVLELTFTNLRSEPVASRRLEPADYLGGELAGRDKMPVRQPIHIALEIADPGSEAVSYHITIVN